MAFDALFTRDVALPLALAAYTVMDGSPPALPSGYAQTAPIQADDAALSAMADPHPAVAAMTKNTNVFGLMGRDAGTRTAFVSFRGTQDLADWLQDFDAVPENYAPIAGFGQVHDGFQDVYQLVRGNIAANLTTACADCDQILVTGHSLGAALAVLAAPDIVSKMPPNTIEPRLITFAGPRVGLPDFATAFNAAIESCFRVVNFLDIVPHVPPAPYVHVGAEIDVDSGGPIDVIDRHSLDAYRAGLTAFIAAHPVTLTLSRQQTTGNDTAAARAEPAERSSRRSPR
ncbi:MAG: triacylglycerol lipase [Mycobacterium sp.]|nr:triacylglycerol lipase [Mycobacterium sp.]